MLILTLWLSRSEVKEVLRRKKRLSYNHCVATVSIVDAEWRQDRDVNKGGQPRHRKGVYVMELWGVEE